MKRTWKNNMKKFFSFLITLIFYFLIYGTLHEMFNENISLLRPCTTTDYLWGILSFVGMSILIYRRTYFSDNDVIEEASDKTEKTIVFLILTTMLTMSFYLFFGAIQLLSGFGEGLLHPFSKGSPVEITVILSISFLFAYIYLKKE